MCSIQLHAADLLYLIISKLDYVNMKLVQQVQTSVIHKLLFCISTGNLNLQQKLLHLLHATLAITSASSTTTTATTSTGEKGHNRQGSVDSVVASANVNEALALVQSSFDLFTKCVMDALTAPSNQSMLQHWMDFVLATLPYVKNGFRYMLVPILMCVCNQISVRCDTIEIMVHEKPASASSSTSNAERELIVLLMGLEKMVMFCLTERTMNDEWFGSIKSDGVPTPQIPGNSALIGLAQVVHSEDTTTATTTKARDTVMYHLPVILHILSNVWRVFREPQWDDETIQTMGDAKKDAILHSFSYAADAAKKRLETIFEKLFKFSTIDFVEGLTEIFFMENPSSLEFNDEGVEEGELQFTTMEILSNTPTSTPQHIISSLLDSIRQRTPNTYQSRRRKILRQGKL